MKGIFMTLETPVVLPESEENTIDSASEKKPARLKRPAPAYDLRLRKKKRRKKKPVNPDDPDDETDTDDDDDDDDEGTGGSDEDDDDDDDGGDEDENELQQIDTKPKTIQQNPFETTQEKPNKEALKEKPKGPEKTERSPWQQMVDFFVHGAKGAMIKNGDISPKASLADKLLLGLGFKSFKKDILLQEQSQKYWNQKAMGKKADLRLLNTDLIDKKLSEETKRELMPQKLAARERLNQKSKDEAQMQKDLAERIVQQNREHNIQVQRKTQEQADSARVNTSKETIKTGQPKTEEVTVSQKTPIPTAQIETTVAKHVSSLEKQTVQSATTQQVQAQQQLRTEESMKQSVQATQKAAVQQIKSGDEQQMMAQQKAMEAQAQAQVQARNQSQLMNQNISADQQIAAQQRAMEAQTQAQIQAQTQAQIQAQIQAQTQAQSQQMGLQQAANMLAGMGVTTLNARMPLHPPHAHPPHDHPQHGRPPEKSLTPHHHPRGGDKAPSLDDVVDTTVAGIEQRAGDPNTVSRLGQGLNHGNGTLPGAGSRVPDKAPEELDPTQQNRNNLSR